MRWKKKEEELLYFGKSKRITKFLWFPLTIDNETRWLEKATIEFQYKSKYATLLAKPLIEEGYWVERKWIDKEEH